MTNEERAVILRLNSGSTKFYFKPGALRLENTRYEPNQVAGVAESGAVKIAQVSSAVQTFYDFIVQNMQYSTDTTSTPGFTWAGWQALLAFFQSIAVYRVNAFQFKPYSLADSVGNYIDVRYWLADIQQAQSHGEVDSYFGKLTFRKEG